MDSRRNTSSNEVDASYLSKSECDVQDTNRDRNGLTSMERGEASSHAVSRMSSGCFSACSVPGMYVDKELPMHGAHRDASLDDVNNWFPCKMGSKSGKRYCRAITLVFCLVLGLTGIMVSSWVINWAEEHRKPTINQLTPLDIDLRSIRDDISAIYININRLKELTYANSVAINEITNGAIKIPGLEEASAKRQKFGKNNSSINQASYPQRFDKSQISRSKAVPSSQPEGDVELHPIEHEADIF